MLVVPAFAKLNLGLALRGRRADGFHEIDTVIVPVDWHDLVSVSPIAGPSELTVDGPHADACGDPAANLAQAAALALVAWAPPDGVTGLRIHLHKRLPVAAGLGGGSADAAAVLRAGAEFLNVSPHARAGLDTLAAGLGSDVPAALRCAAVRARGRGEHLERIDVAVRHVVIAIAGAGSTPAAYAATSVADMEAGDRIDTLVSRLADPATPAADLDDLAGSGLEGPACRAQPDLFAGLTRLRSDVPVRWHLTGSGGAAFSFAADRTDADARAAAALAAGFSARVCRLLGSGAARA